MLQGFSHQATNRVAAVLHFRLKKYNYDNPDFADLKRYPLLFIFYFNLHVVKSSQPVSQMGGGVNLGKIPASPGSISLVKLYGKNNFLELSTFKSCFYVE